MKKYFRPLIIILFFLFVMLSILLEFSPGMIIGRNFWDFLITMIAIVPAAFVLISLFEVWVKRETVEKHMGEKSPVKGILWAIVLAGTIVGGLYVALPLSMVFYRKGARADVVFTFLFCATICRIPMTLFEANILGIKFTAIRFLISLPLVIVCSVILGKIANKSELMKR